jgi:hypothetical protein
VEGSGDSTGYFKESFVEDPWRHLMPATGPGKGADPHWRAPTRDEGKPETAEARLSPVDSAYSGEVGEAVKDAGEIDIDDVFELSRLGMLWGSTIIDA